MKLRGIYRYTECARQASLAMHGFYARSYYVKSPELLKELKAIGYSDKAINKLTEKDIKFIKRAKLSNSEIEKLKSENIEEKYINRVDTSLLNLTSMNENDDGCGMRPLTREELVDMSLDSFEQELKKKGKSLNRQKHWNMLSENAGFSERCRWLGYSKDQFNQSEREYLSHHILNYKEIKQLHDEGVSDSDIKYTNYYVWRLALLNERRGLSVLNELYNMNIKEPVTREEIIKLARTPTKFNNLIKDHRALEGSYFEDDVQSKSSVSKKI